MDNRSINSPLDSIASPSVEDLANRENSELDYPVGDMPQRVEEYGLFPKSESSDKEPLIGQFDEPEVCFQGHHSDRNSIGSYTSLGKYIVTDCYSYTVNS